MGNLDVLFRRFSHLKLILANLRSCLTKNMRIRGKNPDIDDLVGGDIVNLSGSKVRARI